MMQRCSELGKNSATWQLLVRFDRNNLKVKKGPNGHYLESKCRDELRKSLPAQSFEELMNWVAKWLKRLDEMNDMVSSGAKSRQDNDKESEEEVKEEIANPSVVDLCSDEEDAESVVRFPDKETLDAESVISSSSLIVLDDELGEVNLKDYADHVDGKLDEASLRKRNRREVDNTSVNASKQTSIKEFLTPKKTKRKQTPSPVFRRSLKTYVRRPKLPGSGAAGSQVLRELNVKDGTTSNTSAEEDKSSDLMVIDDLSQEVAASIEETHESVITEKTEPRTPTDKEPKQTGIKKKVSNSNNLIEKETSSSDPSTSQEIESNSNSDALQNVPMKSDPEVHLERNGEAKENNEPNAKSESESEKPDTRVNEPNQVGAKVQPLLKDLLSTDSEAHIEDAPNTNNTPEVRPQFPINAIRIRSDLVSSSVDTIRVRTDLLQEQVDQPPSRAPVDPPEPSKAPGVAEKRRLSPEQSVHGQPKRSATSVSASTYSPSIPEAAAPAYTTSYQVNGPPAPAPATTSSYPATVPPKACPVFSRSRQLVVPPPPLVISTQSSVVVPPPVINAGYPRPLSVVAPTIINSSYPVNPGRANSFWYPPPSHRPAIPVVTRPSTTPTFQSLRPPAPCTSASYQRTNPVPAVRARALSFKPILPRAPGPGTTHRYPTMNSMAPAPATATCYQTNNASNIAPTGCNRPTDLNNIMGMLAQVEFFAYGQKNNEAFHLVNQLRLSLQKGAANNSQAPQRNA